jgi:hypothetical protein
MKKTLKEGYALIPDGEQVIRIKKIDESEYKKFQKLTVVIEDVDGATANVNFNFTKDDGTSNDVAEGIYTRMCRVLLNDQTLDEIDSDELIGCYGLVEIEHNEGSRGGIFANVKKWIARAEKFDKASSSAGSGATTKKKTAAEILAEARAKAQK